MAQVIKKHSALQDKAKKEWIYLGIVWVVALLTFLLPLIFHEMLVYLVPLIALSTAVQLSWKSQIVIRGNKGEKKVFAKLKKLPQSYYVLNDVTIKTGTKEAQIDHIVISTSGIWCVETKSHLGRIYGTELDEYWTQMKRSNKGRAYTTSFYNPVTQNAVHCKRLRNYLHEAIRLYVPIKSVVVFTSARLKVQTDTPVLKPKQLIPLIQSVDGEKNVLSKSTIDSIIRAIS